MLQIIVIIALVLASFYLAYKAKTHVKGVGQVKKVVYQVGTFGAGAMAVALFVGLSVLWVAKDEIVTLDKVYFGETMPTGQIVARSNQNGPQAKVLNPGFHFIPMVRFEYDLNTATVITVPANQYGIVTAKDGSALPEGQVIADEWENYNDMIDAEKFMGTLDEEGNVVGKRGQKGMQLTVLPPGDYRINPYLFKVQLGNALQVKTGEVAVIRSNVQTVKNCDVKVIDEGLTTALVPKGCVGVWDEPLYQGMYFLNANAYKPTLISTRAQVWAYKGGYTTKKINLTVNDDGTIAQQTENIKIDVPENAADKAINVRVEGWTVPVEARVTVQVSPKNAPKVVAGVGSLQNVEDKITTPNIRDSLRTIGGRAPSGCKTVNKVKRCKDEGAKVLDFVSKRESINEKVLAAIKPATEQAGVTIIDVNLGEPAIPPELLVANQRSQIAGQLNKTYKAEKETQKLRIEVEKNRATAAQQETLVTAQIAEKAAKNYKNKRKLEGEGEKLYLTQVADGEKARKNVLGESNVVYLKALEIVASNPDMVKVSQTSVTSGGEGGSLEGMAAVFSGNSNLNQLLKAPVAK